MDSSIQLGVGGYPHLCELDNPQTAEGEGVGNTVHSISESARWSLVGGRGAAPVLHSGGVQGEGDCVESRLRKAQFMTGCRMASLRRSERKGVLNAVMIIISG